MEAIYLIIGVVITLISICERFSAFERATTGRGYILDAIVLTMFVVTVSILGWPLTVCWIIYSEARRP